MGNCHCATKGRDDDRDDEQHLQTVLLVHTGHDVEHQGPEDNEGKQREVRRDQEDQPRRLTQNLYPLLNQANAEKEQVENRPEDPKSTCSRRKREILRKLTQICIRGRTKQCAVYGHK